MSNGYEDFKSGPTGEDLTKLSALAARMYTEEQAVEKAEESLKKAKDALRVTCEREIPELMMKCGVSEFKTTTGLKLQIQDLVSCSITEENNTAAVSWLDEHGHGGLVKRVILIEFPREQEEAAKKLLARLKAFKNVVMKSTVHPQTLKSFVKEQLTTGKDLPMALFGATQFKRAKVLVPTQNPIAGAG